MQNTVWINRVSFPHKELEEMNKGLGDCNSISQNPVREVESLWVLWDKGLVTGHTPSWFWRCWGKRRCGKGSWRIRGKGTKKSAWSPGVGKKSEQEGTCWGQRRESLWRGLWSLLESHNLCRSTTKCLMVSLGSPPVSGVSHQEEETMQSSGEQGRTGTCSSLWSPQHHSSPCI